MENVVSFCDYRQKKIEDAIEKELDIMDEEMVRVLSVFDNFPDLFASCTITCEDDNSITYSFRSKKPENKDE